MSRWKPLVEGGILLLLALATWMPTNVMADIAIGNVSSDAAAGRDSLGSVSGQKLILDSAGRHIVVYADQSGRLAVTFANSNPATSSSWSAPVKSPTPANAYKHPAAVLVSLTSLRIIVEGGTSSAGIEDVPVTLTRDGSNNILSASFTTATVLDTSGSAAMPSAILAHNGNILAAWSRTDATTSKIKSARWISGIGWRNFGNTTSTFDDVVVDTVALSRMFPAIVQRQDNRKVYVIANRDATVTSLVFNSASFDGTNWGWSAQNLSYETNAARGMEDTPSAAWDATTNTVEVIYDISGTQNYGVIRLSSSDAKTRIDTPTVAATQNDWGLIQVDQSTGDYYIFFIDANSADAGRVKFARRSGGVWLSTVTVVDGDTNNVGLNGLRLGSSAGIEIVYGESTSLPSPPVTLHFATVTGIVSSLPATSLTTSTASDPSDANQTMTISGTLTNLATSSGVSGQSISVQRSIDNASWTTVATVTSGTSGKYSTTTRLSSPGLHYFRSVFVGTSSLQPSTSPTDTHLVRPISTFTFTTGTLASDVAIQPTSMPTGGGRKLIEDSYGKLIVAYTDSSGRLAVTWANGNPTLSGAWAVPIHSPTPIDGYARPAAVIDSTGTLRVFSEGGAGPGQLVDFPVSLLRDGSGNIINATFGSPTVLDSSGQAKFPTALKADNGDILLAWSFKDATSSQVRELRWLQSSGWRNLANTGNSPDVIITDTSDTSRINPALVQRLDNHHLYLLGNRGEVSPASKLVFNKATYTATAWTWGTQNLSYETDAARGNADTPSLAWDPKRNVVVVIYDHSGFNRYVMIQLDSADAKQRLDTPDLVGFDNNDWGTIEVDSLTGDYYVFGLATPVGVERGKVMFTRWTGAAWNATFQVLDGDADNEGIGAKVSGTSNGIDILYGKGTAVPTQIRNARITVAGIQRPTSLSLSASPRRPTVGATVTISGTLKDTISGDGLSGRVITIQRSSDQTTWTTVGTAPTTSTGSYAFQTSFSTSGTVYLRAVFGGDAFHQTVTSPTDSVRVR